MASKQGKIKNGLQYVLFQSFFFIIKSIPFSWSTWIGRKIGALGFKVMKKRRLLTIDNIRNARERGYLDPGIDDYQLAKAAWEHLSLNAMEFIYYYTRTPEELKQNLQLIGTENLQRVLTKKKGAIMVMGHIGNWELLGMLLSVSGFDLSPLVKVQSNAVFDQIIQEKRSSIGMKVIPRTSFLRPIIEAFRRNEMVPFLMDQADERSGVSIDVFGRCSSIPRGPAEFALKTGTPVIFAYIVRESPIKHTVYVTEELKLIQTGNYQQDLLENTEMFIKLIEDAIKKHPDQWLWMHKLWRNKVK